MHFWQTMSPHVEVVPALPVPERNRCWLHRVPPAVCLCASGGLHPMRWLEWRSRKVNLTTVFSGEELSGHGHFTALPEKGYLFLNRDQHHANAHEH